MIRSHGENGLRGMESVSFRFFACGHKHGAPNGAFRVKPIPPRTSRNLLLEVKRPADSSFDFRHDRGLEPASPVGQFVMLHRAYGLAVRIGLQLEPRHTRKHYLVLAAAKLFA